MDRLAWLDWDWVWYADCGEQWLQAIDPDDTDCGHIVIEFDICREVEPETIAALLSPEFKSIMVKKWRD